jgi:hypothetical protein
MSQLKPKIIASKAVDIQKGLQDISLGIPHYYFNKTLKVGKAIRLAANIRGFEAIHPLDKLEIIAIELGIDPDQLHASTLPLLEDLSDVKLYKDKSGKIERIEETVPPLNKLLEDAGKYWGEMEPTEIERNGVSALDVTSTCPIPRDKLLANMPELNETKFDVLMDCGKSGRFLSEYNSTSGEAIIYSPTIWDVNSESILRFYSELSQTGRDQILDAAEKIKNYPGLPIEELQLPRPLLGEALSCGFVENASTLTSKGEKNFLFFPTAKMKLHAEALSQGTGFDKVKAIIACVRHGEHYADITRIRYPSLLLQRLLERGYLNPHSESREQYAILELNGVLKVEKAGSRWRPVLIRSDTNEEALKAAIDVLSTGEPITSKLVSAQARSLLVSGSFIDPVRNRARTKDLPIMSQHSLKALLEQLRGESID